MKVKIFKIEGKNYFVKKILHQTIVQLFNCLTTDSRGMMSNNKQNYQNNEGERVLVKAGLLGMNPD